MARKPAADPVPMAPNLATTPNLESIAEQNVIQTHKQETQELIIRLNIDDEPVDYSYAGFIDRARSVVQATGQMMLQLGALLMVIKRAESQQRFSAALDQIGVGERFAYKAIAVVRRVGEDFKKRQLVASLGTAKALTIFSELDDDEIADLAADSVRQDEIDAMSSRELRDTLRREREERQQEQAASDEIVARKDKKINDLTKRQRALDRGPVRERVEEMITVYDELIVEHMALANKVETLLSEVKAVYKEAGQRMDADIDERLEQGAAAIQSQISRICKLAGI